MYGRVDTTTQWINRYPLDREIGSIQLSSKSTARCDRSDVERYPLCMQIGSKYTLFDGFTNNTR